MTALGCVIYSHLRNGLVAVITPRRSFNLSWRFSGSSATHECNWWTCDSPSGTFGMQIQPGLTPPRMKQEQPTCITLSGRERRTRFHTKEKRNIRHWIEPSTFLKCWERTWVWLFQGKKRCLLSLLADVCAASCVCTCVCVHNYSNLRGKITTGMDIWINRRAAENRARCVWSVNGSLCEKNIYCKMLPVYHKAK